MIAITVDAKQAINYFDNLIRKAPKTFDYAAKDMAKDCKRGARYRVTTRARAAPIFYHRKGWLHQSIDIRKRGKATWDCWQNPAIAPYGAVIEEGRTGIHFRVEPGKGYYGEGFTMPGGRLPQRGGLHFMRDAARSTQRRAKRISTRHVKRLIKGG